MNNLNNLSDVQINGMIDYLQNILLERGGLKQEPPQNSNYSHNSEEDKAQKNPINQIIQKAKKLYLKLNPVKSIILKQGLFKV